MSSPPRSNVGKKTQQREQVQGSLVEHPALKRSDCSFSERDLEYNELEVARQRILAKIKARSHFARSSRPEPAARENYDRENDGEGFLNPLNNEMNLESMNGHDIRLVAPKAQQRMSGSASAAKLYVKNFEAENNNENELRGFPGSGKFPGTGEFPGSGKIPGSGKLLSQWT